MPCLDLLVQLSKARETGRIDGDFLFLIDCICTAHADTSGQSERVDEKCLNLCDWMSPLGLLLQVASITAQRPEAGTGSFPTRQIIVIMITNKKRCVPGTPSRK